MGKEKKLSASEPVTNKNFDFSSGNKGSVIKFKKKTNYILNNSVSLLVYLTAFFVFYFSRKHTLLLEKNYITLLEFLIISLISGSLLSGKFILTAQHEIYTIIKKLYISLIISLGMVSILLYMFDVTNISRYLLMGSIIIGFIIEVFYYLLKTENTEQTGVTKKVKISLNYFLTDGLILSVLCYLVIIRNIGVDNLNDNHRILLTTIYISWLFAAAITHRFNPIEVARTKWNAFALQIKFYILIISFMGFGVFLLQVKLQYLQYFIEAILFYSVISFIVFVALFAEKVTNKTDEVTSKFLRAYELKGPAISSVVRGNFVKYKFKNEEEHESSLKQKLQFEYLKDYGEVFRFLNRMLDLKSFDTRKTFIIRSVDLYNISVLPLNSHQLIINLHQLNDLRRINDYLRVINKRLLKGGVFAGALIPNKNRYKRYLNKYPYLAANLFAFADFIWKRVFPKTPITRNIYFTFTKGKDRALSLAEGLGRLVYCGFEVLDLTEMNGIVYFAARKAKEATTEQNPNYSPIFKMKRIGQNGKTIYVYKLRTMHPYSEYIQDFIYQHNSLEEGGKFKDDFRIPGWGIILRKLWVDELPMLINWFKGDLKLVGVRPISSHYMSLYSKEHQEIRKMFKPGLIPPFYADMPKTIEEIEISEKVYLEIYKHSPLKTDIKYLVKALNNILLKKKRSA